MYNKHYEVIKKHMHTHTYIPTQELLLISNNNKA